MLNIILYSGKQTDKLTNSSNKYLPNTKVVLVVSISSLIFSIDSFNKTLIYL